MSADVPLWGVILMEGGWGTECELACTTPCSANGAIGGTLVLRARGRVNIAPAWYLTTSACGATG